MFGFTQPGSLMNPMSAMIQQLMQQGQGGGPPMGGSSGGSSTGNSGTPLDYMMPGATGTAGARSGIPAPPQPAQQPDPTAAANAGAQSMNQGLSSLMGALKPMMGQNPQDPFNLIPKQQGGALGSAAAYTGGAAGGGMPGTFGGWAVAPQGTQTLPNASVLAGGGSLSMPAPSSMQAQNPGMIQSFLQSLGIGGI